MGRGKQFKGGEIILSPGFSPWLAHYVSELVVKQSTMAKVELKQHYSSYCNQEERGRKEDRKRMGTRYVTSDLLPFP